MTGAGRPSMTSGAAQSRGWPPFGGHDTKGHDTRAHDTGGQTQNGSVGPRAASSWTLICGSGELVHRVVDAAGLQRGLAGEILLVVVADVGAGHVLVADAGDALADLLALHLRHVAQHAFLAEVAPREVVHRQRGRVVGRQRDQVVEHAGALRRICLEGLDPTVGLGRERGLVVVHAHELGAVILGDRLARLLPLVEHLLAEAQRPVEGRRVVVGELRLRIGGAHPVHHAGDLPDMRLLGLDPQQVGAVLHRGDAVQHDPVLARAGAEVTLVTRRRLLPEAEPEISAALTGYLRDEGITVLTGLSYRRIARTDRGVELTVAIDGADEVIAAEQVLLTTGRSPNC
ncbi:MAG: FAD-dependent oxidoreductase [Rhodospirillales bacterium]|nr:FAD-dependent oxidoreductase [Rhodospirillales bacterium]